MTAAVHDEHEGTGLRRRPVASTQQDTEHESVAATPGASPTGRTNGPARSAPTVQPRVPRKSLADLLFAPITFFLGDGIAEDPQMATVAFVESLRYHYGPHCPRFEHSSFRDAVSTARTASKFLLVYLHSNLHDDTEPFCKKTLCTQEMSQFINENESLVAWAGCVQHTEGFGVSMTLGAAKFPYLALLTCVSRGVTVVEKITGNVSTRATIRQLNTALERNNQVLATARQIQQQRVEAQLLREQQDREYQESLEADRKREEEARLAAEREREERERAETEARRQLEEEERLKKAKEDAIAAKQERLSQSQPPARRPPPGATYKTAVLKFHLHNGQRLERVFYAHDTLALVRDYIDVEFHNREISISNYELATNFPKRVYGPDELELTLEQADLAPQALVFVQDLDS